MTASPAVEHTGAGPDAAPGVDPVALVERLAAGATRTDRLTHLERLPARSGVVADWPAWADPTVVAAYSSRGVSTPWRHQVRAAEHAHAGEHVVLAPGTASGKSLAYLLPGLSAIRAGRGPRGQRGSSTLYLAPTKALAQDQRSSIDALGLDVRVATHDGSLQLVCNQDRLLKIFRITGLAKVFTIHPSADEALA